MANANYLSAQHNGRLNKEPLDRVALARLLLVKRSRETSTAAWKTDSVFFCNSIEVYSLWRVSNHPLAENVGSSNLVWRGA